MIRYRVLGPLDLRRVDGTELLSVLAQPKRSALLAYLAVEGGAGFHRRDTLINLFWPDSPMERARRSLNQALYGLRQSLGEGVIASCGDGTLTVDRTLFWCDAVEFETALAEDRLTDALELYRGVLLEGFFVSGAPEFENWLDLDRGRLGARAVAAAWTLAEREAMTGNGPGEASWARRAAALAPDDEGVLCRLLEVLDRLGDRAGAMAAYRAFERRLAADAGAGPAAATAELFRRIRGPAVAPAPDHPPAPSTAVPVPATPLIGREDERARVLALLQDGDTRLVTLTGPGGIGKTRLVLEIGADASPLFPDGVCFMPLARVASAELVPTALARRLAIPAGPSGPLEQVERRLAQRATLLVLDECEHVLGIAPFLATLLERAPRLRILVTSREPLNLRGEWVVPLEGLPVPPATAVDVDAFESVRLFVATARRASGAFEVDDEARPHVIRICRLVQGIPLALELAAGWTRALTCEEICREIERSHRFLTGSLRDVPERHGSLWAAFEHSWRLLAESQRTVLCRLAVFRGDFTREAALAVADATLDMLAALVDKSLVQRRPAGRYELLGTLRDFVEEKSAENQLAHEETRGRHAAYYMDLLARLPDELPGGTPRDDMLTRVGLDVDNVRAAWSTTCVRGEIRALARGADPLFVFFDCRGWLYDAEGAFAEAATALAPDTSRHGSTPDDLRARERLLAMVLARQGAACARLGQPEKAKALLERALALARGSDDAAEAAFALDRLGVLACERGEFETAYRLEHESLELRRALGDPSGVATSLNNLGSLAYAVRDHESAKRLFQECVGLQRQLGDSAGEAISLQNLGYTAFMLGDVEAAQRLLHDALAVTRGLGSRMLIARALLNLGDFSSALQRTEDARSYLEAALGIALESGAEPLMLEVMVGLSGAYRRAGDPVTALEIAALVLHHEMAEPRSRSVATTLAASLQAELPSDVAGPALVRGRMMTIEDTAQGILHRAPPEPA
jgi:predicted ATPase/DNA-binding SARP family transcriptional activator/Tfp pilus assembly protein PilF